MFFEITLLCPQYRGKFAFTWIAATRGVKYLSPKQIQNTDIEKLCTDIMTLLSTKSQVPKGRLSLTLAAKLVNGVIKILYQKTLLLQNSLSEYLILVRTRISKQEPIERKTKKRKPVVSDEVKHPIDKLAEVVAPELQITDRDVEQALQSVPCVTIDSITLRDEIPRRTMPLEEEGGFGDEDLGVHLLPAIIETLAEKSELKSRPALRRRAASPCAIEVLDVIRIPDVSEVLQAETAPGQPQSVDNIEVQQHETPKKHKLPKDSEIESPIRVEEKVEKLLETPKKRKLLKDKEDELIIRTEEPVSKRGVRMHKVIVKTRLQPRTKLMRCDLQEENAEIFEDAHDLTIDMKIFRDISEELVEILSSPMGDTSIDRVRAQESRDSRTTGSLPGLLRKSRKTPPTSAVRPPTAIRGTSRPIEPVESIEEPTLIQTPELQHQMLLEVERVEAPDVDILQLPISHSTAIKSMLLEERDIQAVTLETIREDEPIVQKSPPQEQDLPVHSPSSRHEQIIRIINAWDFENRDLTIEDICIKPINRLNVAVAFFDLLYLNKLQYVTLQREQDSLALKKILKGPVLQKGII